MLILAGHKVAEKFFMGEIIPKFGTKSAVLIYDYFTI